MRVYEAVRLLKQLDAAQRILKKNTNLENAESVESNILDPILFTVCKAADQLENIEFEYFPKL